MKEIDLREIGEALRTQDNLATAHPLFIVEQRDRIYGIDPDFGGEIAWTDADGEADDEEAERLEAKWRETRREPDGWSRSSYTDRWRFVTACFTRKGCEDYIAANGHNLDSPRIYVASAHRNREWQAVRAHLMAQPAPNREEVGADPKLPEALSRRPAAPQPEGLPAGMSTRADGGHRTDPEVLAKSTAFGEHLAEAERVAAQQPPPAGCTGMAASWCPVHGDCTCRPDPLEDGPEDGDRFDFDRDSPTCPLHGDQSSHAALRSHDLAGWRRAGELEEALDELAADGVVRGMAARVRDNAAERGVQDPLAHALAILSAPAPPSPWKALEELVGELEGYRHHPDWTYRIRVKEGLRIARCLRRALGLPERGAGHG